MKIFFLYVMAVFYVGAGINHFLHPQMYLDIMPPWLPAHPALVKISGVCEILFALLLLPASTRVMGAWSVIILLIAIFPANIQMALNFRRAANPNLWIALLRLPLQILLIWWAWIYTKTPK